MLAATVEVHGGDYWDWEVEGSPDGQRRVNYRPYLRLVCLLHWTVMIALPRAWTKAIGGKEDNIVRVKTSDGLASAPYRPIDDESLIALDWMFVD